MINLDGKFLASKIFEKLKNDVFNIIDLRGYAPHLCVILVGNDAASHAYVSAKKRACEKINCKITVLFFETISEDQLLKIIRGINDDKKIDGLIVQLPLLKNINVQRIIDNIDPQKDVDGFHSLNYGRMARGLSAYIPATPLGILKILEYYNIQTVGRHCVVVGRGNTVGAPLSILLGMNSSTGNATVTICHSLTKNLKEITLQADILIAAVGKPFLIKADMIRSSIVVIDVGISRVPDDFKKNGYRLQGDVDYENVAPMCSHITPVPGGVGPMTIAALLSNTVDAAYGRHSIKKIQK